jgi:3,4-dihydroxy 2-butanone 4-phosphate synthase/GTP cyclohydrolase II
MTRAIRIAKGSTTERRTPFATVEEAIAAVRAGKMIIVVDDEDRENEGDLTMAAELVTPEAINFMATHGRGLVCLAMTPDRLDALDIPLQVQQNSSRTGTAMCVGIEAKAHTSTGISAPDRAATILAAVDPHTRPDDLARPGHVFPLRARSGGVLVRTGHTEAAVDLARAAGLSPAGAICEVMRNDGTMARVPDLGKFARKHGLLMITIADLVRWRLRHEQLVQHAAAAKLPTEYGEFLVHAYESPTDGMTHVALVQGRHGARPLQVPDRRCLPFGTMRLRAATRDGDASDFSRRPRRAAVSQSGRPGHRPRQQDSRVRAPGPGAGHRRSQ